MVLCALWIASISAGKISSPLSRNSTRLPGTMGAAAYASSVGKNEGSPSRKSGNNRCGGTRTQPLSRSNASRQTLGVFINTLPEPASRTGLDGPSWQVDCCTFSIHDGSGARLRHPDSGRSQLVHQLRAGGLQPGPRLLPACVAGGAARGALGLGSGLRAAALRLAGRPRTGHALTAQRYGIRVESIT